MSKTRALTRILTSTAIKFGPAMGLAAVRHLNNQFLAGELAAATALVRREFILNREVAEKFYNKYKGEMAPEVRELFEQHCMENDKENEMTIDNNSSNPPVPSGPGQDKTPLSGGAFDKALALLKSGVVTREHVSQVLTTLDSIVAAHIRIAESNAATDNRMREIWANFRNDTDRCRHAATYLEQFREYLSPEELSACVVSLISVQLGTNKK